LAALFIEFAYTVLLNMPQNKIGSFRSTFSKYG